MTETLIGLIPYAVVLFVGVVLLNFAKTFGNIVLVACVVYMYLMKIDPTNFIQPALTYATKVAASVSVGV